MKRLKSARISVTLPVEMLEDFKYRSNVTGISISKLIFHRLRTRNAIVLVPQAIQEQVEKLINLVSQMEQTKTFDSETLQILKDYCEMFHNLVDTSIPCELLKVKRKKKE